MEKEKMKYVLERIEYSTQPIDTIKGNLQNMIDEELAGALHKPADMELVQLCQSLLWNILTNGEIRYEDPVEENKQELLQRIQMK